MAETETFPDRKRGSGVKLVYDLPVGSKAYNDYILYGFKQWSHFSMLGDLERYIDTNNSL